LVKVKLGGKNFGGERRFEIKICLRIICQNENVFGDFL
jgi:hypothetical protein